jgi:hypothetical protein
VNSHIPAKQQPGAEQGSIAHASHINLVSLRHRVRRAANRSIQLIRA